MGLFGNNAEKDAKKAAENQALHDVRDRLAALPLVDLAEETVRTIFTGEGRGAESGGCGQGLITKHWDPTESFFGIDDSARNELDAIIREGLQVAEHACLVRWEVSGGDTTSVTLKLTRVGHQALLDGTVRQLLGG